MLDTTPADLKRVAPQPKSFFSIDQTDQLIDTRLGPIKNLLTLTRHSSTRAPIATAQRRSGGFLLTQFALTPAFRQYQARHVDIAARHVRYTRSNADQAHRPDQHLRAVIPSGSEELTPQHHAGAADQIRIIEVPPTPSRSRRHRTGR